MKDTKIISRKKFLSLILFSILIVFISNKNIFKYRIHKEEKFYKTNFKSIEDYNRKREALLLEDYDKAYLLDLQNSRTIWINKSMMTYAELWK